MPGLETKIEDLDNRHLLKNNLASSLLFAALGSLLLSVYFGYLKWEMLMAVIPFWPLFLILPGVEAVSARFLSFSVHKWFITLLTLAALIGVWIYASSHPFKMENLSGQLSSLMRLGAPAASLIPVSSVSNVNPSPSTNSGIYQSAPDLKKVDSSITKNYLMVANMIHVYQASKGSFPASLSELADKYFTGSVPINDSTGQPFYYRASQDSRGVRTKFVLCPSESADEKTCFIEYIKSETYK